MRILLCFLAFSALFSEGYSQTAQTGALEGRITDREGRPLPGSAVQSGARNALADSDGYFRLVLPAGKHIVWVRSIGFVSDTSEVIIESGKTRFKDVRLLVDRAMLATAEIIGDRRPVQGGIDLKARALEYQSGPLSGVEGLIRTLPGVSGNSELSSQYNVRGGNFDENLVYINGFEVYRPFLARAGEQEGQSVINPDLVDRIYFSAGGFEASYGDRMSSVLDIGYRVPDSLAIRTEVSLLGARLALDALSRDKKFKSITGVRYRTNQILIGSLDTDADFRPRYFDLQTAMSYDFSPKWSLKFVGQWAENIYEVVPSTRTTDFGNIQEALRLTVFFEGMESYTYSTLFGGLNAVNKVDESLELSYGFSAFRTLEEEYFDVIGAYRLGELELNLGSDEFGEIKVERGAGEFQNYGRNRLDALIAAAEHKGQKRFEKSTLSWGIKLQAEDIIDRYREWERIDSAGYSIPHQPSPSPPGTLPVVPGEGPALFESFSSQALIQSVRLSGFVQDSRSWRFSKGGLFALSSGIRFNSWSLNGQTTVSPRVGISYRPEWKSDQLFRFSTGLYSQPAFYREMRSLEGGVNEDIRAQNSFHLIAGHELRMRMWGRPFKLVSEAYYKHMWDLVPYEIDNVRIRYSAVNQATGYAAGFDARINGEFVPGIDSWASLGVLSVQEDIEGDGAGYIPRPTDRRVNFALYFQDYLPNDPSFRVSMSLFFSTGQPFGAPQSERKDQVFRIPNYRRFDIGFIKVLKESGKKGKIGLFKSFDSAWVGLEVFNLLQIRNTVSYLWIRDISSANQYAVPNYLTDRVLNIKLNLAI